MYLLQPYQSLTICWGGGLDVVHYQALLFPQQALYTVVFNMYISIVSNICFCKSRKTEFEL
jgi:hypothetical protein